MANLMNRYYWLIIGLAAILTVWPLDSFAKIQAEVKIGIAGRQVRDSWIPLEFTVLKSLGKEINGHLIVRNIAMDQMHNIHLLSTYSHSVTTGENTEFPFLIEFPARIETMSSFLQFELLDENHVIDSRILRLPEPDQYAFSMTTQQYLLVVGSPDSRFRIINDAFESNISILLGPSELPEEEVYFDGVGGIILDGFLLEEISDKAWHSLMHWLGGGGTIILTPELVLHNQESERLTRLMSVKVIGEVNLESPEDIDKYIHQRAHDCACETKERDSQRISRLSSISLIHVQTPGSKVWYSDQGFPVLVKHDHGTGAVWLFTIDLDKTNFMGGEDRTSFKEDLWKLMASKIKARKRHYYEREVVTPPEAQVSNLVSLIIWYVVIFFLVLGPINYVFLKRIDRREFILVTVPIISILFSLIAYMIGYKQRGGEVVINKSHLQVGQVGDPVVSLQSYVGILAARSRPISVKTFHTGDEGIFYAEWTNPYDIMSRQKTYVPRYEHHYSQVKVSDLTLAKWSMYFGMAWSAFRYEQSIDGTVGLSGRNLSGKVNNHLPFDLDNCFVVFNGGSAQLGRLKSGEERSWGLVIPPPGEKETRCDGSVCVTNLEEKLDSEVKYNQYLDAMNHFRNLADVPILIGWAEGPGPIQVEIDTPGTHRPELNMFLFQMPMDLEGDTIRIAPGVSRVNIRSSWRDFEEEMRLMREGSYVFRDMDFMGPEQEFIVNITMPFHITDPVETESFKLIYGREMPKSSGTDTSSKKQIAYYLWEWDKSKWIKVHVSGEYEGAVDVDNPERFIRFPEGSIRAKADIASLGETVETEPMEGLGSKERSMTAISRLKKEYVDVDFIDVDYSGRTRSGP